MESMEGGHYRSPVPINVALLVQYRIWLEFAIVILRGFEHYVLQCTDMAIMEEDAVNLLYLHRRHGFLSSVG